VRRLRRIPAIVFAGDPRVWRGAAAVAVPLLTLIAFYLAWPRDYYTGTNSVEAFSYIANTVPGEPVCVPELQIPAGTGRIRLQVISRTRLRPALKMALTLDASRRIIDSRLGPIGVPANRISAAVFALPALLASRAEQPASICLTAAGIVSWGGTPLARVPGVAAPTAGGRRLAGRIAVWYLPLAGQRSYLGRADAILHRASLFRPGVVGPWLFVVILLVMLPGLALASVRCLAVATAADRSASGERRLAAWIFAIAALNFACWALLTPAFQAPDEVDHFAYTQSLVERGEAPSRNPRARADRWSSAEALLLDDMGFLTDHQVGGSRLPWTTPDQAHYRSQVAARHHSSSNGGGNETAATHGALYYAALAPAYMLASGSPLAQLTLMRLTSALIGALTVLFAFLLARELAPGRPWLAVLVALLVAYEPMYGFVSGSVNNDVGVNAGAAALELLLIRMLRRGVTLPWGLLTGVLLIALPILKGTAYSLYPVAAIAFLATLWRHHRRSDVVGWVGVALGAAGTRALASRLSGAFSRSSGNTPGVGSSVNASNAALEHPFGYLSYLWEVFLPRLSFMAPHFEATGWPAFAIFVERGWGAFGWYDVYFPQWVYIVLLVAMLIAPLLAIVAAKREWAFVRSHALELTILLLVPIAVVAGFDAAFYISGVRRYVPEFGRYAFPAIAPLAVLVVASLHAFGRRRMVFAGAGLLAGMLALSYVSHLLTLTAFYA
jgi:hypothetical protein